LRGTRFPTRFAPRRERLVQHLHRPDLAEKAWLSLLLTVGIIMAFVWDYGLFAWTGSLREGLGNGLFFALLAGPSGLGSQPIRHMIVGFMDNPS